MEWTETFRRGNRPALTVTAIAGLWAAWTMAPRFSMPVGAITPAPASAQAVIDPAGGTGALKVYHFYAGAATIYRGERVPVCFGVGNARAVRIDPPVEEITPSINRCFAVSPPKSTTYTLRATGNDGRELTRSFRVEVQAPPPKFRLFAHSRGEIARGEYVSICYGVEHAALVRLDPPGMALPPSAQQCVQLMPQAGVRFTLTATSAEGLEVRESFNVRVR